MAEERHHPVEALVQVDRGPGLPAIGAREDAQPRDDVGGPPHPLGAVVQHHRQLGAPERDPLALGGRGDCAPHGPRQGGVGVGVEHALKRADGPPQGVEVRGDEAQRVVELVGDAGDELAERPQLLRLDELRLGLPQALAGAVEGLLGHPEIVLAAAEPFGDVAAQEREQTQAVEEKESPDDLRRWIVPGYPRSAAGETQAERNGDRPGGGQRGGGGDPQVHEQGRRHHLHDVQHDEGAAGAARVEDQGGDQYDVGADRQGRHPAEPRAPAHAPMIQSVDHRRDGARGGARPEVEHPQPPRQQGKSRESGDGQPANAHGPAQVVAPILGGNVAQAPQLHARITADGAAFP
jgi:hypothetical protein